MPNLTRTTVTPVAGVPASVLLGRIYAAARRIVTALAVTTPPETGATGGLKTRESG